MYRIIVILALLILLYFLVRSALRKLIAEARTTPPESQLSDSNQMIQDPVCRVFVPKGVAVRKEIGGHTYFFCSRDCAKAFQSQLSGQQPE